ncbi:MULTISPECIES: DUF4123 domain-containing protein [unclassified Pseudovibrio]|uniref:DUF4123 domain-containing protein n=1 Tax=unclassified Pseudovibrio TaxID=2627060 RepID=UPI0007B2EBBF|nr:MULTISPECIES: DUF4123 domain-containing protein [unclassified Pseudovibrio]KZK95254.1 hypothetical protein PsW74_04038 [Pseudovibrio sp. W74]KZL10420.1 hypothetical protein PsAD14_01327 [Pseudovibrio sp. Ad14]
MSLEDRFESITAQGAAVGAKPYLVLDASWQDELAGSIRSKGEDGWEPLMGSSAEKKQDAHYRTPLLVDLKVHPEALTTWLEAGFTEKLGIIVFSSKPIEELRTSLKRFISVITPESGKPVYLRFYDARVLYCFLRHGFPEQWKDFFKGIELIAAPYDYTSSFAIYRLREDVLQVGVETEDGKDYRWFTHENKDWAVDNYRATFPFRQIEQRQYDDMMFCAQQSFYHEIEQFLRKAFPKETKDVPHKELIEFIGEAQKHADKQGYNDETCFFYWAVLSFMAGLTFYEMDEVLNVLQDAALTRETQLADIIYFSGVEQNNPKLIEFGELMSVEISDKDDNKVKMGKWDFIAQNS